MARGPIGVELVKKGIETEGNIERALEYQKTHPEEKLVDILYKLRLGNPEKLAKGLGEILDEKTIYLTPEKIKVRITDYISVDMAVEFRAIPFELAGGTIKVAFPTIASNEYVETLRILLLNKGLVMERYVTFEECIDNILSELKLNANKIDIDQNVTNLVDNIIKDGMRRRASDIHIEPMQECVRVRFRIDGNLIEIAKIDKTKQTQIINRLKSISNMHQEKQDDQDGRITDYQDYNIRVSSQKNIYGEKFVLRLLKKNQTIKNIYDLGYPKDPKLVNAAFNKRNSITIIAAPTGEGKTTTLYSAISELNSPDINITTIEDPVEIRIPGLNQIEIGPRNSFAEALRTVLRQDPNIILVGEIRDQETAEIAMQAGQTGHYVLTTIHTINAIETITRLRKMNISDYDISSTVATAISQRLVRKLCPKCRRKRQMTEQEKEIIRKVADKYDMKVNLDNAETYDPVGCDYCEHSGFYDRIAIFETLLFSDEIKEMIVQGKSTLDIRKQALKEGYKPLVTQGIERVLDGTTTLIELNSKLLFY